MGVCSSSRVISLDGLRQVDGRSCEHIAKISKSNELLGGSESSEAEQDRLHHGK